MSQLSLSLKQTLTQFDLNIDHTFILTGIHGVFGHSGSGKSTLLRCIAGLENSADGDVFFNDQCLQSSQQNTFVKPEKRAIAYLFQQSLLFPHLNVLENLRYAQKRRNAMRAPDKAEGNTQSTIELDDLIQTMNLRPLLQQNVNHLSGGERQKVALARAIINEPQLLLLDEPISALDRASKLMMMKLINDVHHKFHIPMLYVSHSLDELQQLAKYITVLEQGEIIASGDTHQIIHQLNYQRNGSQQLHSIAKQTSLSLAVVEKDNGYGLTKLQTSCGISLFMPKEHLLPHHELANNMTDELTLRCFILAADVSISLSKPDNSSIVNHLSATITDIITDNKSVLVSLVVNQHPFFASISAFSLEKLALQIGQSVFIQCKASAIRTS